MPPNQARSDTASATSCRSAARPARASSRSSRSRWRRIADGMEGQRGYRRQRRLDQPAAVPGHPDLRPEDRAPGGGPERQQAGGPHRFDLGHQPRLAGLDLGGTWCLVQAALAPRRPLEVLHQRWSGRSRPHRCRRSRAPRRGPDRQVRRRARLRCPRGPRLLADQHQRRLAWAGAEDRLRGVPIERHPRQSAAARRRAFSERLSGTNSAAVVAPSLISPCRVGYPTAQRLKPRRR